MKTAIIHDFFGTIGGGEKLVLTLARAINADIYTTDVNKPNLEKMGTSGVKIISIGKTVPIPVMKQVHASILFSLLKLRGYDQFIISGNWAIFAAKHNKPNTLYCHTPTRMFYNDYKQFYKLAPLWAKPFFSVWVFLHKMWLERFIKHIGNIIANSGDCQKRIKRYYLREAPIINPPIKQYRFMKSGNFWLSVNRIYPHKRLELQLESFRQLPDERLVIVGGVTTGDHSIRYLDRLKKNLPKNVSLLGEVPEKKLAELYGTCKGFITTSQNEDFGMTILEAMSAGKPVIATAEGGHIETMIDGKTGRLVRADTTQIVQAIKKIGKNPLKFRKACQERAKYFSEKKFIHKMKDALNTAFKNV